MYNLEQTITSEEFSGSWCNSNQVTSSIMEAVSLITPVLEKFFIRTVAEALPEQRETALGQRCQEFIREESNHSRVHQKFNTSLLGYLGKAPLGLGFVESVLDMTNRYISLSNRLLLAAALEHLTAVLSRVYMKQEKVLLINSTFVSELFAFHAREELAHCSVVFDLWRSQDSIGRAGRMLTMISILLTGAIYVAIAVPWILYRKNGLNVWNTLKAISCFTATNIADIRDYSPVVDFFSFVKPDYHPDIMFKDDNPGVTH